MNYQFTLKYSPSKDIQEKEVFQFMFGKALSLKLEMILTQ